MIRDSLPRDGVFTTIKVVHGVPLFWEKHLERLRKISLEEILGYIAENRITDAALRIDVLENGEIQYAARSLPENNSLVRAVTVTPSSPLPTIKQRNRHIYEQADAFAKQNGANSALFSSNGFLLESTISNILSIDENNNLVTPSLVSRGLKGITRQIFLDGKYIKEKDIFVLSSGPLILINCLRVQGVTHLDGRILVDPRDLMERVQEIIKKEEERFYTL